MAVLLRIHGRVQGVGYRAWMVAAAKRFGLAGWVRNRADGTVEALIHGEELAMRRLIEACHEGPPAAVVEKVEEKPASDHPEAGFLQKPTV